MSQRTSAGIRRSIERQKDMNLAYEQRLRGYTWQGKPIRGYQTPAYQRELRSKIAHGRARIKRLEAEETRVARQEVSKRNPLPVGRYVTVRAKRLPNGRIELRGIR